MTRSDFSVSALYLRMIAELIEARGVDATYWLRVSNIDPDVLLQTNGRIDGHSLLTAVNHAVTLSKRPDLGFLLGERLHIHSHGALGMAALSARSVAEMMQLLQEYLAVRADLFKLVEIEHHDTTTWQLHSTLALAEAHKAVMPAALLAIKHAIEFVSFGECTVCQLYFDFPAPSGALHEHQHWHFNAPFNGLTIDKTDSLRPLRLANRASFEEALSICQHALTELVTEKNLSAQLTRWLLSACPNFPSLSQCAEHFHVTERSLHRRLKADGTSYQQLLDTVRQEVAFRHLTNNRLTVQEIAYLTGFSDPANFRKAFKRWTGLSPKAYRDQSKRPQLSGKVERHH